MNGGRSTGNALLGVNGPLHAMITRELGRSIRRSRTVRRALSSPDLAPWLALVDAQCPGLVDVERARLARIIRRNTDDAPTDGDSLTPQGGSA